MERRSRQPFCVLNSYLPLYVYRALREPTPCHGPNMPKDDLPNGAQKAPSAYPHPLADGLHPHARCDTCHSRDWHAARFRQPSSEPHSYADREDRPLHERLGSFEQLGAFQQRVARG